MKLVRVKLLDHYASIDEDISKDFHLTVIGWEVDSDKNYYRVCMILDDDGTPHSPYMSIIKKDIVSKEVIHERVLPIQRKSRTRPLKRNGNRSSQD